MSVLGNDVLDSRVETQGGEYILKQELAMVIQRIHPAFLSFHPVCYRLCMLLILHMDACMRSGWSGTGVPYPHRESTGVWIPDVQADNSIM